MGQHERNVLEKDLTVPPLEVSEPMAPYPLPTGSIDFLKVGLRQRGSPSAFGIRQSGLLPAFAQLAQRDCIRILAHGGLIGASVSLVNLVG